MMLGKRSRSGSCTLSKHASLGLHHKLTDGHWSGCCTCRKRHQKCDETKPACWNCRLRGVECGGYGIKLTEFTAHSGRDGQMVSKMVSGSSSKNPSGIRQRQKHRDRETTPRTANRKSKVPPRADETVRIEPGEASGSSPIQFIHVQPSEPGTRRASDNTHPASPGASSAQQCPSHDNNEATSPRSSKPSTASTTNELMHIFSPGEHHAEDNIDGPVDDEFDQSWLDSSGSGQQNALSTSRVLAPSPWEQFDAYFSMPSFEIETTSRPFSVASDSSASAAILDEDEPITEEQQTMRAIEEAFVNFNEPVLAPRPNDPYDQYLFGHCKYLAAPRSYM